MLGTRMGLSFAFPSWPFFMTFHASRFTRWLRRRGWAFEVAIRCCARLRRPGRLTDSPARTNVVLLLRRTVRPFTTPVRIPPPRCGYVVAVPRLAPARRSVGTPFDWRGNARPRVSSRVEWRRGWDSNPRSRCQDSSFQDQFNQNLKFKNRPTSSTIPTIPQRDSAV